MIDGVFNLENKTLTDQRIAEILVKNITNKKIIAVETLINRYLGEMSNNKNDIKFLNSHNFYDSLMKNPKQYARWCILLAVDFINDYYRRYMSFISYNVKKQKNLVEFNFEISKADYNNDSVFVSILITKNGIVAEINNEFVSIVRERDKKNGFTGKWNANISDNLKKSLPLIENDTNKDISYKNLVYKY